MRLRKKLRRRAAIAVLMAFAMIPILGIVAITLEGGVLQDYRRKLQATADAAALAAADDLYLHFPTGQGLDPYGTAATSARDTATANGFTATPTSQITPGGPSTTVTVNIPPLTGLFIGKKGYAEVVIQQNLSRTFSRVFGTDTLPVTARAVARGTWKSQNVGILLLDPSSSGSLSSSGNGTVTVSQASIVVDSSSASGSVSTGGGTLVAPEYDLSGDPGYSVSGGGSMTGTVVSNVSPSPDPLAYLPYPDSSTMTNQGNCHISGQGNKTLSPGYYPNGIVIDSGANVTMQPGLYDMGSKGFSYTGWGSLTALGVTIFNQGTGTNDSIAITGQGQVSMTPMTTGPYAGISLFQARESTTPIKVSGGGQMNITGTFYAANALLDISGSAGNNTIGSQYISYNLKLSGNGNVTIDWAAGASKSRQIGLVE